MIASATILDSAIQTLLSSLPHTTWITLVPKLSQLLSRYSTGLSLSVALDEFNVPAPPDPAPSYLTAHIVRIARHAPELWLVRLQNNHHVILHAHTLCTGRFFPGARFTFRADQLAKSDPAVRANLLQLAQRAFRADNSVHPEASPSNVTKLADVPRFTQDTTLLSQSQKEDDGLEEVRSIFLPTTLLLFDLSTVTSSLVLREPAQTYTLQRVWNERNLMPDFIFGHVVQISHRIIRLADTDVCANQPSVEWHLHDDQTAFCEMLNEGDQILLEKANVHPTGTSFSIQTSPATIIYRVCSTNTESDRPCKRQRPISASTPTTALDASHLADLHYASKQPLTVYALVATTPSKGAKCVEIDCGAGVIVRVKRRVDIEKGDEIVLQDVRRVDQERVHGAPGWIASSVCNLSTMTGVLYCPFARRIVSVTEAARQDARATLAPTVHVCAYITDVRLARERELVKLTLENRDRQGSCEVFVRSRGFEQLFGVSREEFWQAEMLDEVEKFAGIVNGQCWIMAITRGRFSECASAQVAACVRGKAL